MAAARAKGVWDAVRWLLVVLVIGTVAGLSLSAFVPVPAGPPPPGPGGPPPQQHVSVQAILVLSTVTMALLLALLIVYGRTYRETRATHMLGLVVFLGALLAQVVLTSPLLYKAYNVGPGGVGPFLALGEFMMAAALALFLYLSLQ